jgi:DNA-binding MarR family transcriptional regulator
MNMEADAADAELGDLLRTTVAQLTRRFRSERPAGELGDTALAVLSWLQRNGPHTLSQLSDHDRVAPASMSQSVNRLTSAGYATRTRDPGDRRRVLFSATPQGERLAIAAREQRNAWLEGQLRALAVDERETIARACVLLGRVAGMSKA